MDNINNLYDDIIAGPAGDALPLLKQNAYLIDRIGRYIGSIYRNAPSSSGFFDDNNIVNIWLDDIHEPLKVLSISPGSYNLLNESNNYFIKLPGIINTNAHQTLSPFQLSFFGDDLQISFASVLYQAFSGAVIRSESTKEEMFAFYDKGYNDRTGAMGIFTASFGKNHMLEQIKFFGTFTMTLTQWRNFDERYLFAEPAEIYFGDLYDDNIIRGQEKYLHLTKQKAILIDRIDRYIGSIYSDAVKYIGLIRLFEYNNIVNIWLDDIHGPIKVLSISPGSYNLLNESNNYFIKLPGIINTNVHKTLSSYLYFTFFGGDVQISFASVLYQAFSGAVIRSESTKEEMFAFYDKGYNPTGYNPDKGSMVIFTASFGKNHMLEQIKFLGIFTMTLTRWMNFDERYLFAEPAATFGNLNEDKKDPTNDALHARVTTAHETDAATNTETTSGVSSEETAHTSYNEMPVDTTGNVDAAASEL